MLNPKRAFKDAVTRLNSAYLDSLWELSSLLSTIEFFSEGQVLSDSKLHLEHVRLLDEAILDSKAASYKSKQIDRRDAIYVLYRVIEPLDTPPGLAEVKSGMERSEMQHRLRKVFSLMGNVQITRQIWLPQIWLGRTFAMFEELPKKFIQHFPSSHRKFVTDFYHRMQSEFKCTIPQLAFLFVLLILYYKQVYKKLLNHLNNLWPQLETGLAPSKNWTDNQIKKLNVLLSLPYRESARPLLTFTKEKIKQFGPPFLVNVCIDEFIAHFSKTTDELRQMRTTRVYTLGGEGWGFSPLERYPIVFYGSKKQPEKCIVPNIRILATAVPDLLHFMLHDSFSSNENDLRALDNFRGLVQEVYLRLMIKNKLPKLIVIEERDYLRGKRPVSGPDSTVIDLNTKRLIVIESKARRFLAETKYTMNEEILDQNLKDVYGAIRKLPEKINDLYKGLPAYSREQDAINQTKVNEPICVCVMGEDASLIMKSIRHRAEKEDDHPLHGFALPFCIMGIENFEIAVGISVSRDIPLAALLLEFIEDSTQIGLNSPAAELFRNRIPESGSTYAESFFNKWVDWLQKQR